MNIMGMGMVTSTHMSMTTRLDMATRITRMNMTTAIIALRATITHGARSPHAQHAHR